MVKKNQLVKDDAKKVKKAVQQNKEKQSLKQKQNVQKEKKPVKKAPVQKKKEEETKKIDKSKKIKKTQKAEPVQKEQPKPEQVFSNYDEFINQKNKTLNEIKSDVKSWIKLDQNQIKKAVSALIKHHLGKKNAQNLLDDSQEDFIYIEISMKKIPEKFSIRPVAVQFLLFFFEFFQFQPNPKSNLFKRLQFTFLYVRLRSSTRFQEQNLGSEFRLSSQGYSKLIKKYPTFQDKRQLCNKYDLFFCDYKIYDLLGKHTGREFYQRKKIPYPLDCSGNAKSLEKKLNDLQNNTYFVFGNGPVYSLKVARVNMNQDQVVENIVQGFFNLIGHILCEQVTKEDIEQISIKTFNSVSLPVYNYLSPKEVKALKK